MLVFSISILQEQDEQKTGPPTLHKARTNHNDFSTGEHPLQLSSPQQCLCKKAWETLRKVTAHEISRKLGHFYDSL